MTDELIITEKLKCCLKPTRTHTVWEAQDCGFSTGFVSAISCFSLPTCSAKQEHFPKNSYGDLCCTSWVISLVWNVTRNRITRLKSQYTPFFGINVWSSFLHFSASEYFTDETISWRNDKAVWLRLCLFAQLWRRDSGNSGHPRLCGWVRGSPFESHVPLPLNLKQFLFYFVCFWLYFTMF